MIQVLRQCQREINEFPEGAGETWLIHAFMKKTSATPKQNIEVAKQRLKEFK